MSNLKPRVFIIRHGETEWAKLGRSTGITEIGLTQAGVGQVSLAAATLVGSDKFLDPRRLLHIFVSPRLRTRETCKLLLEPYSDIVTSKITYTESIREWDYGDYEGRTNQEIRDLRYQRGLDVHKKWNIFSDGCEGGESMQQITERLDKLIADIKEIQKRGLAEGKPADILIVAHGLILRCFWKRWNSLSIDFPLRIIFDTCEMATLSYKGNDIDEPAFHLGVTLPCRSEEKVVA